LLKEDDDVALRRRALDANIAKLRRARDLLDEFYRPFFHYD
jgi:hypothetical protein